MDFCSRNDFILLEGTIKKSKRKLFFQMLVPSNHFLIFYTRVFIAEEGAKTTKDNEKEAAAEVAKEAEISYYEQLGEIRSRDPRQSSLKFMYAVPMKNGKDKPEQTLSASQRVKKEEEDRRFDLNLKVDENGEDEMVRAFKAKLQQNNQTESELLCQPALPPSYLQEEKERITGAARKGTALDNLVGRRHKNVLTTAEIEGMK